MVEARKVVELRDGFVPQLTGIPALVQDRSRKSPEGVVNALQSSKDAGNDFGLLYPISMFPCADGWFHVNVVPTFWRAFTHMLGMPELETDPRFAESPDRVLNRDLLDQIIRERLGGKTKAEIMRLGEEARVPTGILQELHEVLADEHLAVRDFWQEVDGVRCPKLAYRFTDS